LSRHPACAPQQEQGPLQLARNGQQQTLPPTQPWSSQRVSPPDWSHWATLVQNSPRPRRGAAAVVVVVGAGVVVVVATVPGVVHLADGMQRLLPLM